MQEEGAPGGTWECEIQDTGVGRVIVAQGWDLGQVDVG